ncbi:glycosyltransferase family 2 protein [Photobacterium leiognathi]|uniref:glycosyltransferase family 2 protein n=1 Tax=Photobacterium leiognathi TaxID=553611 RepID=UPI0027358C37|nr:glycosyltransferase family 2 protein [Photobacterium leiognathi]
MIDILMATYNGSNYLRNQLLSLQQQTEEDWTLYIRDDGSTDDTIEIINDFSRNDKRIKVITDSFGNLGAGKTFLELTKYSTSDYIIFCDQDDIWFEKKLENLFSSASEKLSTDKPSLVYCDAYGYDSTKGIISLNSISRAHATCLNEFLFFNAGYQGCSILFNRSLCNLLNEYTPDFYMHDDIVSLLAHTFGDVYFLNEPLMLYRQHDSNVTGNINYSFSTKLMKIFNNDGFVISKSHYNEKVNFYHFYHDKISDDDKKIFEAYFNYPKLNLKDRLILIYRYKFKMGKDKLSLYVKTIFQKPLES